VYPTIPSFDYLEQITFTDPGVKPFVAYTQRTSHPADGRALHSEAGYLRWVAGRPEFIIASPTGVAEVHTGEAEPVSGGMEFAFHSIAMVGSPTAKRVESVSRMLVVRDDILEYELHMGAVGERHQVHLRAVLHRLV
jgi:hypothetical protein